MVAASLEELIQERGNVAHMLRNGTMAAFPFPMRSEYSNWRDEQRAWKTSAVLFDQSHHMTDVSFKGPDAIRLMSRIGVNSFAAFGKNKAKQLVACTEDGHVIGDAVLFGLDDDEVSIVGPPFVSRWAEYQAEIGGWDVTVTRDDATPLNPLGRKNFRFQLQGPAAMGIVSATAGGSLPDIKPFHIGEFRIAGRPVRALNHSMSKRAGLEIWGPVADGPAVLTALLEAGAPHGLRQAGAIAYSTTALESGWIGVQLPAIYTGAAMKGYREWLPATGPEAMGSIGGSFVSDRIEDYYTTPWDLGYGALVKFDHDFIGRAALEESQRRPHRRKVWFRWNADDSARVMRSGLLDDEAHRAKYLQAPYAVYSTWPADSVLVDGKVAGIAIRTGYTTNVGSWYSLGILDEAYVQNGREVTIVWGEEDGGTRKPAVERHAQTSVRAVVSTTRLG
ncbi:aminomethyltransferase family protein [Amycolatopsis pithecellobii]|uniref:Aminomethyl transferase family protein n=1 Tax=Amycolatopsis pithecellobii TaxID=664692 RepID=A0A6N7YZE8_9PSEU|nr:aminomethyltransferase family protein [Amycolatopsis pithecellobii]MTD57282.1 aminomethyl transferase family protein [Amycolatopsis pithecellobii]